MSENHSYIYEGAAFLEYYIAEDYHSLDLMLDKYIYVELIMVPEHQRGLGTATRLLKKVLDFADKHDLPVMLEPYSTQEEGGMTTEQLIKWYEKQGFERYSDLMGDIYVR